MAVDMGYRTNEVIMEGPRQDQIKSLVQQDYAKVEVYYQTLNVQSIMQQMKYSVTMHLTEKRKASVTWDLSCPCFSNASGRGGFIKPGQRFKHR
jgi:hypothetical protein